MEKKKNHTSLFKVPTVSENNTPTGETAEIGAPDRGRKKMKHN